MSELPNSVLYVKNGENGKWWDTAKRKNQILAGWPNIPAKVIENFDITTIDSIFRHHYPGGSTQNLNALKRLLERPSRHVWITMQGGFMWWCLVKDQAGANSEDREGEIHFWLNCERPWSNASVGGRLLAIENLPGPVQKIAGFRATVCRPQAWADVLRIIQDQTDPNALASARARDDYQQAIRKLITSLGPKDFELLVDLILTRSGWERTTILGSTQEGIDLAAENPAMDERAFVQIKSTADQSVLNDYVGKYNDRSELYQKMIFAVHSPKGDLKSDDCSIQIWTDEKIAQLVVRLGLGERVESMRG